MAVTIYSTPTCPYCTMAKEYFTQKNVKFEDVDVSVQQDKAKEMVQKSGQMGVPVIVIPETDSHSGHEEVIVGFDREKLAQLLKIAEEEPL